jgi:hypothetical protein
MTTKIGATTTDPAKKDFKGAGVEGLKATKENDHDRS